MDGDNSTSGMSNVSVRVQNIDTPMFACAVFYALVRLGNKCLALHCSCVYIHRYRLF